MKTAEDILKEKGGSVCSVSVDATVRDALEVMRENGIGSILVKDGDEITGIWTERDLMRDSLSEDFDPRTARIADHMTSDLQYTPHSDSVYDLMDRCLGLRKRRLLVEKDGRFIGLLSAGDVMKACLQEKDRDFKRLNELVSWEYYEKWK